ncbi:MAG: hypothetical protein K6F53_11495 [Lachnospiraceae bacterium]|nr:hypothetical protein [Lachnospiraceae bacterium]
MNKKILAICDGESRYAEGLMEFMSEKSSLPFRIHLFTDRKCFDSCPDKEEIECLLISERLYREDPTVPGIPHIVILSESGNILDPTLHHIKKYQACESIYKELLSYFTKESSEIGKQLRMGPANMKVIGVYTPIARCLQTTFAMTLGQMLAKEHKTLYMNFERYSGLSELLRTEFRSDITDLMYYLECAKEKLVYKIDEIREQVNGLDFIPPAAVFQNVAGIKGEQWKELFEEIATGAGYEYLILDLTDGMLDLWEVLRGCHLVYTITKGDTIALAKMYQYETLLKTMNYEDVLNKTRKCRFPVFRCLSARFDLLTVGDMAAYVKENILPDVLGL